MNPITFEQVVALLSFLAMLVSMFNGARNLAKSNQEGAERLVRIEEGIKSLRKDLEENQKAFAAYMARTDESISNVRSTINDHTARLAVVEDAVKANSGRLGRLEAAHDSEHVGH